MAPQATARVTILDPPDHRHRDRPFGTRPVAKLAELVVPPAVRPPARCQATRVNITRHQRHVGPPATHCHRDRPVGRVVPVDPARPVAKLAGPVITPAVRRPVRHQATRVLLTRHQRREGPPTTHRHGGRSVGHGPAAKLAVEVLSPAVRRPIARAIRCDPYAHRTVHRRDGRAEPFPVGWVGEDFSCPVPDSHDQSRGRSHSVPRQSAACIAYDVHIRRDASRTPRRAEPPWTRRLTPPRTAGSGGSPIQPPTPRRSRPP